MTRTFSERLRQALEHRLDTVVPLFSLVCDGQVISGVCLARDPGEAEELLERAFRQLTRISSSFIAERATALSSDYEWLERLRKLVRLLVDLANPDTDVGDNKNAFSSLFAEWDVFLKMWSAAARLPDAPVSILVENLVRLYMTSERNIEVNFEGLDNALSDEADRLYETILNSSGKLSKTAYYKVGGAEGWQKLQEKVELHRLWKIASAWEAMA